MLDGQQEVPGVSHSQTRQRAANTGDRLQSDRTAPSRGHIFSRQQKKKKKQIRKYVAFEMILSIDSLGHTKTKGNSEQIWKKGETHKFPTKVP